MSKRTGKRRQTILHSSIFLRPFVNHNCHGRPIYQYLKPWVNRHLCRTWIFVLRCTITIKSLPWSQHTSKSTGLIHWRAWCKKCVCDDLALTSQFPKKTKIKHGSVDDTHMISVLAHFENKQHKLNWNWKENLNPTVSPYRILLLASFFRQLD